MHITVVQTKDGKTYSGIVMKVNIVGKSSDNVSLLVGQKTVTIPLEDVSSAITKNERLGLDEKGHTRFGDENILEKWKQHRRWLQEKKSRS